MTRRFALASFWRMARNVLAVALIGGAGLLPASAAVPTTAPRTGLARVWFYRDYEPYESLSRPYVRINGEIAGISEPGGAFYRDLAPGQYKLSVDSWGTDINQFPIVTLAPGQVIYAKIESLSAWASNGGARSGYKRDTFYVRLIPPQLALAELPSHPFYGGN